MKKEDVLMFSSGMNEIPITSFNGSFIVNGAADVICRKVFDKGEKKVKVSVQLRDKKTRFNCSSDTDDIQLTCPNHLSLAQFYLIASSRGKFKQAKESNTLVIERLPAYFYRGINQEGKEYFGCNVVMGTKDDCVYRKFYLPRELAFVLKHDITPEFPFVEYDSTLQEHEEVIDEVNTEE